MSIFITCNAMQKVLCPKVLVRKKKLPYGTFFLHPNFVGLNTFYMAFQMLYMDQFMYLIKKRLKILINTVFWITIIANFLKKIGIFSTHMKSKKKFPYGSFFLRTKTFGHNTSCIASHAMKIDNFLKILYK